MTARGAFGVNDDRLDGRTCALAYTPGMNGATNDMDEGRPRRAARGRALVAGLLALAAATAGATAHRKPARASRPASAASAATAASAASAAAGTTAAPTNAANVGKATSASAAAAKAATLAASKASSPRVAAKAASVPIAAASAASAPQPVAGADLAQWCKRITSEIPGVAQPACRDSGLVAGDGRSVQGVPLWWRDVPPASGVPRFKVLLLGGIHGDELASVTLAFDWIARSHAARVPAKSPAAAVAWRFVPLLNPDGLLHVPSTRVNAHGVDLNRNFPTADWAHDAQPYWIERTKKDPRRFPGTQPLSEPESRWLLRQIEQFRPDLIVSVHAPYGLLDFDGPPPAPHRLGSLQLDPVGVYPGSLGNYGSLVKQVPVMTLELKNARQVPPAELAAMWGDLQRWIDQRVAKGGMQASAQPPTKAAAGGSRAARRQD